MELNLIGELRFMKETGIKPNYSDLERRYGVDRHFIKLCFELGKVPDRKKRIYTSIWDPYEEEIRELLRKTGTYKMSVYQYLKNKYKDLPGAYNSFKAYTRRKGIMVVKCTKAHVLFETEPGEQLQFDWKEDLKITLKNGEVIEFNVFSATLGYSREHIFIFSFYRTLDDAIRCMIEVFKRIGGVTKEALTDNMAAIVSITKDGKKVQPRFKALMKDLGVKLKLAKVKSPETKGKCESANRFVNWLRPYDGELESVDELIDVIENVITSQCNTEINQSTKIPPVTLFRKEKEYLSPIGNQSLLETHLHEHIRVQVPSTLLVNYKGNRYSVPKDHIGGYADIYPINDQIYIYHRSDLIAIHNISQSRINYDKDHYIDGLRSSMRYAGADIEEMAERNLKRLANIDKERKL